MSKVDQDKCLLYLADGAIPKADPDISGNGVVLAFILSAYISFAAVLVAYLTGFVDPELLNSVDKRIFRIKAYDGTWPRAHVSLSKAILALGDQQIVTGIAILGAGFQGLRTGTISVYHYQIVLYLAWMSSSVHLSALTILGAELRHNPGLMIWRVSGMLVLLVLLMVGLIPTISNDWGLQWWDGMLPDRSGWGLPARCFWGRLWGDGINSDSILGFIILGVSYLWKVGALFPVAGSWYNRWIRHPSENIATKVLLFLARRHARKPRWYSLWLFRLALAATLPLFGLLSTFASFAASLWLSGLGLVFGTLQVIIPRNQNLWYTANQEEGWGFGQLVPLILLVQPLASISEHYWPGQVAKDQWEDARRSQQMPQDLDRSSETEYRVPTDNLQSTTFMQWLSAEAESSSSSHVRPCLTDLLHSSNLFAFIIYLLNAATFATGFVVYYVDAYSIGNDKTPKWEISAQVVGFSILVIVGIGLALASFSQLGRESGVGQTSPWHKFGLNMRERRRHGTREEGSALDMAELKP